MTLPKDKSAYLDVQLLLDSAKLKGGGILEFPSYSEAHRWRARANMLRSILRKESEIVNAGFGLPPATPYDQLQIKMLTPRARSADSPHVLDLSFTPVSGPVLKDRRGEVIELVQRETDFEAAALNFAKKLIGE